MQGKILYQEGSRYQMRVGNIFVALEKFESAMFADPDFFYLLSWNCYDKDKGRQIMENFDIESEAQAIRLAIAKYDELKTKYQDATNEEKQPANRFEPPF